jgi:hypothetical protein
VPWPARLDGRLQLAQDVERLQAEVDLVGVLLALVEEEGEQGDAGLQGDGQGAGAGVGAGQDGERPRHRRRHGQEERGPGDRRPPQRHHAGRGDHVPLGAEARLQPVQDTEQPHLLGRGWRVGQARRVPGRPAAGRIGPLDGEAGAIPPAGLVPGEKDQGGEPDGHRHRQPGQQ